MRLLDLDYQKEKLSLTALIDNAKASDTDKQIAKAKLAQLDRLRGVETLDTNRQFASPLADFRQRNQSQYGDLKTNVENIEVASLQAVSTELERAAVRALGLSGALGDVVGQILQIGIQRRLIGPLADYAFGKADGSNGSGAIGGFFTQLIGSLGGRASGGYVGPGQMVRVNEGAPPGRVEGFRPVGGGTVIPLGQMAAQSGARGGTVIHQHFSLDARGSIMTPQLIKGIQGYVDQSGIRATEIGAKLGAERAITQAGPSAQKLGTY